MASPVLSYKYPPINPSAKANSQVWKNATAVNGVSFHSERNNSIIINVASNSEVLKTVMSFLAFDVIARDAAGAPIVDAATRNTFGGMARCIQRLIIRFSGTIIDDISMYSDLATLHYSTLSDNEKNQLKKFEGFGDDQYFAGRSKRHVLHRIISSLFVTEQSIPLPALAGIAGLQIEMVLAPAAHVFTTTNVNHYTVENPQLVYEALTPSPEVTTALVSAIRGGRSAFVPFQKVHVFQSNGNGSQQLQIQCPLGQVSSIASIDVVFFDDSAMSVRSTDKSTRFTNANLVDYRVEIAGTNQPIMNSFGYSGGENNDALMISLLSQTGNAYKLGDVWLPGNLDNGAFRISLNFQSDREYHGSGYSTLGAASPFISIFTNHSAPVPSTTRCVTFVTVDALLELNGSDLLISEVF